MSELSGNQADKFARKFFEKGKITNKDRIIESKIAKGQMKYVLKLTSSPRSLLPELCLVGDELE